MIYAMNDDSRAFIKITRKSIMMTVSRANDGGIGSGNGVDLFPAGGGTAEGSIVIDGKRLSSAVASLSSHMRVRMRVYTSEYVPARDAITRARSADIYTHLTL